MGKLNLAKSATTATKDIIRDIIKSLALVSSHYCRSTMKSHYLPSGLSENRLYLDYKDYCTELLVFINTYLLQNLILASTVPKNVIIVANLKIKMMRKN